MDICDNHVPRDNHIMNFFFREIAFRKGDLVLILRQLDKNWYEGEFKGNIGIFPISYVEVK